MKDKICAIMVTYNPEKDLLTNIDSYIEQLDFLYIVDNGSQKECVEILKSLKNNKKIKVIYNESNKGIASALNIGIKEAEKRDFYWVMFLDDDSKASKNMVKNMIDVYDGINNNNNIVSLFPRIIEENNCDNYDSIKSEKLFEEVLYGNSSGNIIKLNIFKKVGYLRDDFFIDSVDNEFCLRIAKYGYKHIRVFSGTLIHNLGDSMKKKFFWKNIITTNHSALRRYYIARNRIILWSLYKNYFPNYVFKDIYRFISELIKIILYEKDKYQKIKMTYIGIIHGFKRKLGKYEILR